ncbi:MAG: hypothetical protein COB02_17990 [Candidatus Cloacimonadota bacterium]|nr:MAG: hypothetical protein COB02_17990 [Candidatus Cloacimonadota bacterium]
MTMLSKDKLIALVNRLINVNGTEDELDDIESLLENELPDPNFVDYIYYPPNGIELSAEEIIEKALAYKPIILGYTDFNKQD